jgi:hypothetical protein
MALFGRDDPPLDVCFEGDTVAKVVLHNRWSKILRAVGVVLM